MDVNHDDDGFEHDGDGQWPFHTFVEQLIIDMFDSGKHFSLCHFLYHDALSTAVFSHLFMFFECLYIKCCWQFGRYDMVA